MVNFSLEMLYCSTEQYVDMNESRHKPEKSQTMFMNGLVIN